ncbi:MAG: hypothetical protein SFY67_09650 [Candidatus Melainabacteria bacterium]|nr:hypothetical protein [Candidatus Melainabacteria bacterium]
MENKENNASQTQNAKKIARAELMQSCKALYIPLALFLSCVSFAAGAFLINEGEAFGWLFISITGFLSITAFIALFSFQNPFRAKGIITPSKPDDN